jgi:hypothetical protein
MILGSVAELTNALDEKEKKLAVLDQSIARREAQVAEQIRSIALLGPALHQLFGMLSRFGFQNADRTVIDRARFAGERVFKFPQQENTGQQR